MAAPDPLAELVDLTGVQEAATSARARVDELLWDRSLRQKGAALRADVARQNSRDSAAIDGIDVSYRIWSSGDAFDDSPIGKAAAGVWRLEQALPELVSPWSKAPFQVLARMHALLGADLFADADLGRPRADDGVDDPLRIKSLPDLASMKVRLAGLMDIATKPTSAPALIQASIVHAELLALRPFAWGNGPVARAAARVTLASRGLDPDFLVEVDSAILAIGRPAYVDAVRSYIAATPEGVGRWIRFYADACGVGARLSAERLTQL